ncbi:MAG: DUF4363 family protein [Clostridia bacterium]|nr:DUF4363 family protein [Clostridia bacterium]
MKRFFAILFIIIILSGISIAEEILLQNAVENVATQSSAILSLIDENEVDINTEEILTSVDNFKNFWNKEERKICYFTSYDKIKSMDESIVKLRYAIKNNDRSLAIENVANIQSYNQFLHYIMGFNLNNLF